MKKFAFFLIVLLLTSNFAAIGKTVEESEVIREFQATGAEQVLKELEFPQVVYDFLPGFDAHELSQELLYGKETQSPMATLKRILDFFLRELSDGKNGITEILLISFLSGLLGVLSKNFTTTGIDEIAFMPCYLLVAGLGLSLFYGVADFVRDGLLFATEFMDASMPVYSSLALISNSSSPSKILSPTITTCVFLMTNFINSIVFPAVFLSAIISVVEHFSSAISIHRINVFFKKCIRWVLCLVATIFAAFLTISQIATQTLSGIGGRTGKYVIGNLVPVVGGFLTETLDTLFTCAGIIRGVFGIVGVIVLGVLFFSVLLRVLARIWLLQVAASISEAISDSRISALLGDLSESLSLLLGALACAMVSFIIYLSMLIRVGSVG